MNVVELLKEQVEKCDGQLAFCQGPKTITFKELYQQCLQGGNYLASLGFKQGDTVLVFVPMSIELYVILMALWLQGMTAMFIDPAVDAKTLERCCKRAKPRGFIGTPLAQMMRIKNRTLRGIKKVLTTGWVPLLPSWSNLSQFEAIEEMAMCDAGTPALITFTSGSTGTPKGTVRSHGFLLAQMRVLRKTLRLCQGKSDLATLPVFALINLACGVTTIIPPVSLKKPADVDSAPILRECGRYRPATAVASPAFFERLISDPGYKKLGSLEALYTGGAPVFPGLLQTLAGALPHTVIIAVYGSTEAEPIAELRYSDITEDDYRQMAEGAGLLAGKVIDDIDCCIIENCWGKPLGKLTGEDFRNIQQDSGQPGEIVVHGEHVLTGYLDGVGDAENKFSVEGAIWHRTGDLGYFNTDGRLWLLGRCSAALEDALGVTYPFAVETAARQYPGIAKAAFCRVNEDRILVVETETFSKDAEKKVANILNSVVKRFHIDRIIIQKIPMDKRHNAKVDYPELLLSLRK